MIVRSDQIAGIDGWFDAVKKVASGAVKGVVKGATSVEKGAVKVTSAGAAAIAKGAAGAAKGVVSGVKFVAKKEPIAPPWSGVNFGTKGWASRLAENITKHGLPGVGTLCSFKKFENSRACKAVGKIVWSAQKQGLEKAFLLPPGSIDAAESGLNAVGKDPVKRAVVKASLVKKGMDPDLVEAIASRNDPPTVWEQILDALGLR